MYDGPCRNLALIVEPETWLIFFHVFPIKISPLFSTNARHTHSNDDSPVFPFYQSHPLQFSLMHLWIRRTWTNSLNNPTRSLPPASLWWRYCLSHRKFVYCIAAISLEHVFLTLKNGFGLQQQCHWIEC